MKIVPALALLVSLSSMNSYAVQQSAPRPGAESGGGGGGICTSPTRCITLPEAGLRFTDPTRPSYELSTQVLDELDSILGKLPKQLQLHSSFVVGNKNEILMVDVVDPRKLAAFLAEYKEVLIQNGSTELSENVEILAFTSQDKTYLIKNKYEALSTKSQALLLIHEYSLRSKKWDLQKTLKLDIAILDYLTALDNNQAPNNKLFLSTLAPNSFEYQSSYLLAEILRDVDFTQPGFMDLFKLSSQGYISISYRNLLELRKFAPNISKEISEGNFQITAIGERGSIAESFEWSIHNRIKAGERRIIIKSDSLEVYAESIPSMSKAVTAAKNCGTHNEFKSTFVIEKSNNLSFVNALSCPLGPHLRTEKFSIEFNGAKYYRLYNDMVGLDLNLPKDLDCRVKTHRDNTSTLICK